MFLVLQFKLATVSTYSLNFKLDFWANGLANLKIGRANSALPNWNTTVLPIWLCLSKSLKKPSLIFWKFLPRFANQVNFNGFPSLISRQFLRSAAAGHFCNTQVWHLLLFKDMIFAQLTPKGGEEWESQKLRRATTGGSAAAAHPFSAALYAYCACERFAQFSSVADLHCGLEK